MQRVRDTASGGSDVLPQLRYGGSIDSSGQHSGTAVCRGWAKDDPAAGSAGKAQTLPFRHDRGGSHSGGGGVGPVSELKSVIFDQYDSVQPFGMAVKENMSSVKWSSEKRRNGSYDVTITGVDNMYGGLVEATFRVTHMGDAVYAVINRASVNGETCVGSTELTVVMLLLYGQLDEETLAGLMVWDSIW